MKSQAFKILGIILLLLIFVALILTPLYKKAPVKRARVKKAMVKKPPAKRVRLDGGKIVIVLDDWGYSLNNLSIIEQIKQPLTCAVLPGLGNSDIVMRRLDRLGCEIILHLPMEPKEKYNLEKDTITAKMNSAQIHDILESDLSSVALAKGVSNHMGSKISEDPRASKAVLAEVKKRKLYFLDSYVTRGSVYPGLARQMNIKFAKRDIFLDNQDDFAYIRGQLDKLKKIAAKQGTAIGIGHDRRNTLLVLKEVLPEMEKEGYKFIFLSQAVQ